MATDINRNLVDRRRGRKFGFIRPYLRTDGRWCIKVRRKGVQKTLYGRTKDEVEYRWKVWQGEDALGQLDYLLQKTQAKLAEAREFLIAAAKHET